MLRRTTKSSPLLQLREEITTLRSGFDTGLLSAEEQFNRMVKVLVALVITLDLNKGAPFNEFCRALDTFTQQHVVQLDQFVADKNIQEVNRMMKDVCDNTVFMGIYKSIIKADCTSIPEVPGLADMFLPVWNQYFYHLVIDEYRKNGYLQDRDTLLKLIDQTENVGLSAALIKELFLLPNAHINTARSHSGLFQPTVTTNQTCSDKAPASGFTYPPA